MHRDKFNQCEITKKSTLLHLAYNVENCQEKNSIFAFCEIFIDVIKTSLGTLFYLFDVLKFNPKRIFGQVCVHRWITIHFLLLKSRPPYMRADHWTSRNNLAWNSHFVKVCTCKLQTQRLLMLLFSYCRWISDRDQIQNTRYGTNFCALPYCPRSGSPTTKDAAFEVWYFGLIRKMQLYYATFQH